MCRGRYPSLCEGGVHIRRDGQIWWLELDHGKANEIGSAQLHELRCLQRRSSLTDREYLKADEAVTESGFYVVPHGFYRHGASLQAVQLHKYFAAGHIEQLDVDAV